MRGEKFTFVALPQNEWIGANTWGISTYNTVYIQYSVLPHRNMCASPWVVVRAAQFWDYAQWEVPQLWLAGVCDMLWWDDREPEQSEVWPYNRSFPAWWSVCEYWSSRDWVMSETHSCRWLGGDCHTSRIWHSAEVQRKFFFACSQTYANPCKPVSFFKKNSISVRTKSIEISKI